MLQYSFIHMSAVPVHPKYNAKSSWTREPSVKRRAYKQSNHSQPTDRRRETSPNNDGLVTGGLVTGLF